MLEHQRILQPNNKSNIGQNSMRNSMANICLMGAALLIASCASSAQKNDVPDQITQESIEGFYELGDLERQQLDAGDCGLFLFAARPEPRFVFFSEAGKGTAKVVLNGKPTVFARSSTEGDVLDLHYTEQVFHSPVENVELKVTINEAVPGDGGSQITKASIRISDSAGWKMVIPVGGATSCVG